MSRVHDALRRAEQMEPALAGEQVRQAPPLPPAPAALEPKDVPASSILDTVLAPAQGTLAGSELLQQVVEIPFTPAQDSYLVDHNQPEEAPGEEFRSLRTRLNHLQSQQPLHTVVVTSPSPAEGKSFTAANLALAQSHMVGNYTLLADFDFRRPTVHHLFQTERTPGVTDYLLGKASLASVMRRVGGTNLYLIPAGTPVKNPLELLNLPEAKTLIDSLPAYFNWVVIDSPPLLFSADANLLTTMSDATILVVRLGSTTIDSITRAMHTLCENNILGIVANGARAGELYSKYTYYYSRKEARPSEDEADDESDQTVAEKETKD